MSLKNFFDFDFSNHPNHHLRKYFVSFHEVDGWGIDEFLFRLIVQIDALQKKWQVRGSSMEIGVHHGRTFILLELLTEADEYSLAVDLFEDMQTLNLDASGSGELDPFFRNLEKFLPDTRNVKVVQVNSLLLERSTILAKSGGQYLRLIHVDGGHYKEIVASDLHLAQSVLADGGVIIMDDYWHSGFPGVQEGVQWFFSHSPVIKIAPFLTGNNKLFLTTHGYHQRYLDALRTLLPEQRKKEVKQFGYSSLCIDIH